MHYLEKTGLCLLSLMSAGGVQAAEFADGIPQTLVEQFTQGRVYADLPVDFPPLDLPDSLSVLGSLDNDFNQIVVFESEQPFEAASAALVDSLFDAGWTLLASLNYEVPTNGFISPTPPDRPVGPDEQYCHDDFGTLTIAQGRGQGGGELLTVRMNNRSLMQPGFSCRQQNEQRRMQRDRGPGFGFAMQNRQYMPRLVLPEQSEPSQPAFGISRFGGGFSGSNDDFETNSRMAAELSLGEVNAHFAEQLEAQGWTLDSDWSGAVSAGGNWTYSPEENLAYIGTLTILKRNDEVYELKFRMVTRNASSNVGIGIVDRIFTR